MPGGVADRCLWDWAPTEPLSETLYILDVFLLNGEPLVTEFKVKGETAVENVLYVCRIKYPLGPGMHYELVHKDQVMKDDMPLSYYFDPRCSDQRVTAVRTRKDGEPIAKRPKLVSTSLEPR